MGRRILLLADDSSVTQKVVSLTFADEGFEVVAVGDGDEAARRLEAGLAPDIVLADVLMPGLTGYELCERIKGDSRLRHVPVMLLVGSFEPFNEAEARRVGADTVLTKPFQSIRELMSKVGSLLSGSKPEAETEAAHDEAPQQQDAAASFADIQMDDEMIEARPAAHNEAPETFAPAAPESTPSPSAAQQPANNSFDDTIRGPYMAAPRGMDAEREAQVFAEAPAPVANVVVAEESRVGQPAFAAHLAGAADADDTLLDLDFEPPATTNEADDFILDLGDDDQFTPAMHQAAPVEEPRSVWAEAAPVEASTPDAAGAFAEAAHGESAPLYDGEVAAEVVAQDEPLEFGGETMSEASSAPRGFVEPEVVPAADTSPAIVEAEFVDGSVEGDVAKPPVFDVEPIFDAEPIVEAEAASAFPPAPSTEGFEVMAARAGVEEGVRPEQLSAEAIDAIARRVVEMMSDKVVREIAWEVVPELAELLIKQKLEEDARKQ